MRRAWLLAFVLTVIAACGSAGIFDWGTGGTTSTASSTGGQDRTTATVGGMAGVGGQGGTWATSTVGTTGGVGDQGGFTSTVGTTGGVGGEVTSSGITGGTDTGTTTTTTTNTSTGTQCHCDCPVGPPDDWSGPGPYSVSTFCLDPAHECTNDGHCPPCCRGPGLPDAGLAIGRCRDFECVNLQP